MAPLENAPEDYLESLHQLWPYADYFVINVSSPNTPGLRALQERARLTELLAAIQSFRVSQTAKPVLLKVAPDLSNHELAGVTELAVQHGLSGLVATNATVLREGLRTPFDEAGGLSGKPLKARSLEVLRFLKSLGMELPVVSVGGITHADDVYARLEAGAVLVQLYTSFIYEGPFLLRQLNRGLLKRLEQNLTLADLSASASSH